jgi:intein/homing endonuclease
MKTMGGKASGPEALKKFLSFVKSVIRRRAGYKVLSVDIHDIICRMAIDTSEGGLRRAALISLSELNDEEMRIAKIGRSLFSNQQRFKSNNSVVYTRKPTREQLDKEWKSLVDSKNGERGIFNRGDLHKVLPQRRIDVIGDLIHRMGTNPCVTADTWVQTVEGPRQVSDLIGKKVNVIVNGQAYPMISEGFFFTGNKLTYQIKTNKGYIIKLTENHQLLKNVNINKKIKQEWIEAKYLKIGDEICLSNHRISNHFSIQNTPIFSFVNENQNDELFDIINVKHDNYISYHQLTKEYKCNEWNGPGTFEEGWLIGEIIGNGGIIKESSETKNHSAYLRFWGDSSEHMKNIAVILTKKYVETRSDFSGTYNIANNTWNVRCIGLYQLCKKYGITKDKMFTSLTEKTSSDFQRGLIRGFFDADGSPQGNLNKGYSVRLSQSNITRLEVIQRMLYRLGIISSLCQNRKESVMRLLPDGHGGKKEYFCEADNELIISKDNIGMYHKFINFFEPAKVNRMNNMMNSYTRTPYKEKFIDQIESIILIGYESVYDVTIQDVHEFCANGIRSHNCGEILLLLMQFCNLSEVICRFSDTLQDLLNKTRISAIIGTYQSMLTDFKYIDKKWKEHQELERLLGVSLTGIYDCPLFFTEESYKNRTFVGNGEIFKQLKECAIETNKIYAKRFGINQSTAVTTGKPSGTVSQVTDTSNGGHPRFAPYYIRRIRIAANDPLFQLMKAEGYTYAPEVGQKEETATVFVIDFPTKAPEGSIFVKDVTSIQQLEFWKVIKTQYTEHNPSVSIYYREHETDQIKEWIRDNWEYITGLSFFPLDENVYELAVYEEITEAQYYELISKIKKVNFAKLIHYEKSDTTDVVKEVACAGGKCEI